MTIYVVVLVLAAVLLQEPARAFGAWVVDTVVLRRPDTSAVVRAVEAELSAITEPGAIPVVAAARLGAALDAAWIEAREVVGTVRPRDIGARVLAGAEAARFAADAKTRRLDGDDPDAPPRAPLAALVAVPTVEAPLHVWYVGPLTGGRRWLSDDVALAESVAFIAARRLDALRVADERYAAALRERQIGQLATEAELRALRAQLNPHFLFNALTTIGYLIQVAPARAQSTLMRLTSLLRGVLRRSTTEFSRLGDEIALVQAYLEIEEARFEERLRVRIAVDAALHEVLIPSLLLQPLVENAVKHGIAPLAAGGEVEVRAELADQQPDGHAMLRVTVRDSGVGHAAPGPFDPPGEGLGLANVAQRLRAHFGDAASLTIDGTPGAGTIVRLALPVRAARAGPRRAGGRAEARMSAAPLRIVLADDERPARLALAGMVARCPDVAIVGEAANGAEAIAVIERERPDLALLDLQMPEVDGLGVVRLLEPGCLPLIAFVTAFDEFAVQAFELNAVDYLLKPVEPARLAATIERARARLAAPATALPEAERVRAAAEAIETRQTTRLTRIPVRRRDDILLLPIGQVASFVAEGELVHVTTLKGERFVVTHALKDIEARLDPARWVRLERGAIVALDAIAKVSPLPGGLYLVALTNGQEVRASRMHSRVLRDQYYSACDFCHRRRESLPTTVGRREPLPHHRVHLLRLPARDAERTPAIARDVLGQEHDLADVAGGVRQRTERGARHGVRLGADDDRARQILRRHAIERFQETAPAGFPARHQRRARVLRLELELAIAVAIRLLAVGGVEVRPARAQVAGDVLDDQREAVRLGIQGEDEAGVVDLGQGLIGQVPVAARFAAQLVDEERLVGRRFGHGDSIAPANRTCQPDIERSGDRGTLRWPCGSIRASSSCRPRPTPCRGAAPR